MTANNSRRRLRFLLAAGVFSVVASPIGFGLFLIISSAGFSLRWNSILIGIASGLYLLGIVSGLYSLFSGAIMIGREPEGQERKKLKTIALLGACGALLSIVLIFWLAARPHGYVVSPREHICMEINNIAAAAYQYRLRSSSPPQGKRTYVGYEIPTTKREATDEFHMGKLFYKIVSLSSDSLVIEGRFEGNISGAVWIQFDSAGRATKSHLFGDMQ